MWVCVRACTYATLEGDVLLLLFASRGGEEGGEPERKKPQNGLRKRQRKNFYNFTTSCYKKRGERKESGDEGGKQESREIV